MNNEGKEDYLSSLCEKAGVKTPFGLIKKTISIVSDKEAPFFNFYLCLFAKITWIEISYQVGDGMRLVKIMTTIPKSYLQYSSREKRWKLKNKHSDSDKEYYVNIFFE